MTYQQLEAKETIPTGGFLWRLSEDISTWLQKILDDKDLWAYYKTLLTHMSEENNSEVFLDLDKSINQLTLPHIHIQDDHIEVSYDNKSYTINIMNVDSKYLPKQLQTYGTWRIDEGKISILSQIPKENRSYAAIHESYDAHLKALETPDPQDHMYQAEQMVFKQVYMDMRNDHNFDISHFIACRVWFFVWAYAANQEFLASKEGSEKDREETLHHNSIIKNLLEHKLPILNKWLYTGQYL